MAELIKVYDEKEFVVFELEVNGFTETIAKARGFSNLFLRHPGELTGYKGTEVKEFGNGMVKEYRVMITISPSESVRDILKMNDAVDAIEERL